MTTILVKQTPQQTHDQLSKVGIEDMGMKGLFTRKAADLQCWSLMQRM